MENSDQEKALSWIKKRIEELDEELAALKALVSVMESNRTPKAEGVQVETEEPKQGSVEVSEKTPPKEARPEPVPQPAKEEVSEVPTAQISIGDRKVAAIFQHDNEMKIDLLVALKPDIPPFKSFFLDKVLGDYEKRDKQREQEGQLPAGGALTYEVLTDNENNITQIKIKNINDQRRTREIISTIRWTIARMMEKENRRPSHPRGNRAHAFHSYQEHQRHYHKARN
ncbi:hypothetical protein [Tardisphaera saccharovorans]|nr:hypothetical protein [TACK group archaeon]